MIKKEITKNKSIKMNLALVAIGISMVLGCPASNNSTGDSDTTAPSFDSSSSVPVADATDFPANSNIMLTYSEVVQAGTGNITIVPSSGGTTLTIAVGDAQVSIAGAVVTINPSNNLAASTTYTLTVPAGAFMDAAGNKTAELTLSFSTAPVMALDTTAPIFDSSSSVPAADATDFPINSNIILTYSEAVQAGTGNITLTPMGGGTALTIAVTDAQVSISGAVVIINPSADLMPSIEYTLSIPAAAIQDLANNPAAILDLTFTTAATADSTAPTLSFSVPAADATGFPVNSAIILTYNEAVKVGTGNITLTPMGGGTALTIAVTDAQVSIAGAVLTINPSAELMPSTEYTLSIPAAAIQDLANNPAAILDLTFTTAATADSTAPTLSFSVPAADATGFPVNSAIILTYNEAVKVGTGNITLTPMGGGTALTIAVTDAQVSIAGAVLTINPSAELMPSTEYTLSIPAAAIQDFADNDAAILDLTFTTAATADSTPPTVESSVPAADGTDFNASSNIKLTYDEPVQAGIGNITITPSGGATLTIAVTDAQVTISGDKVTINPTNSLAVSTTYTLTVAAGAIVDASGNAGSVVTLSFSTAANIVPVVVSSVPVANGINFPINSDITLTYSEAVKVGTGNITITASGGDKLTIAVTDAQVSVSGAVLTIDPSVNLEMDINYVLVIPDAGIQSLADNPAPQHILFFGTAQ